MTKSLRDIPVYQPMSPLTGLGSFGDGLTTNMPALTAFPLRLGVLALNQKRKLCKGPAFGYLPVMSTVQEIEAAIPRLSRVELQQLHTWFEEYVEDHLELTDEVKSKLDESRREIAAASPSPSQRG